MVTFTAGGVEYGLNRPATLFGGFPDVSEIVPDGPPRFVDVNGDGQRVESLGRSLDGIDAIVRRLCS